MTTLQEPSWTVIVGSIAAGVGMYFMLGGLVIVARIGVDRARARISRGRRPRRCTRFAQASHVAVRQAPERSGGPPYDWALGEDLAAEAARFLAGQRPGGDAA